MIGILSYVSWKLNFPGTSIKSRRFPGIVDTPYNSGNCYSVVWSLLKMSTTGHQQKHQKFDFKLGPWWTSTKTQITISQIGLSANMNSVRWLQLCQDTRLKNSQHLTQWLSSQPSWTSLQLQADFTALQSENVWVLTPLRYSIRSLRHYPADFPKLDTSSER